MKNDRCIPLKVGIIGAGGFGRIHHECIAKLERKGLVKLLATADPNPMALAEAEKNFNLHARHVRVFDDYRDMLGFLKQERADYVTVPTPVPLHAEMHAAAIDAGLAVYLEKPPTLDLLEFEHMLAAEKRAVHESNVGFNFTIEPARKQLKARLLAGEFGKIQKLELTAHWPRSEAYFTRAGWAGRLKMNGTWVLDSCLTNAVSHNVHDMLFWAGQGDVMSWARPTWVQSKLLRAYDIESADTVFVRAGFESGTELYIGMTHAITGETLECERVVCEKATIEYRIHPKSEFVVTWTDGHVETFPGFADPFLANQEAYAEYLMGKRDRPLNRLADCQPFVEFCAMAFVATERIVTIPVEPMRLKTGTYRPIPGVGEAVEDFCRSGTFPRAFNGVSLAAGPVKITRQTIHDRLALLDAESLQGEDEKVCLRARA